LLSFCSAVGRKFDFVLDSHPALFADDATVLDGTGVTLWNRVYATDLPDGWVRATVMPDGYLHMFVMQEGELFVVDSPVRYLEAMDAANRRVLEASDETGHLLYRFHDMKSESDEYKNMASLIAHSSARRRLQSTSQGQQMPFTYHGRYGDMHPSCPATMTALDIGLATDFGFGRFNTRTTTTDLTDAEIARTHAEISAYFSIANVLYMDMVHVFIVIKQVR
jgi:hypothetical protein